MRNWEVDVPICTVLRIRSNFIEFLDIFEVLERSSRTCRMQEGQIQGVDPDPLETPGSNLPYQVHQLDLAFLHPSGPFGFQFNTPDMSPDII